MTSLFGASLAVAGTLITALGNHLVALSHPLAKQKGKLTRSQVYFWFGNLGCIIVMGTGCGLAALAYAPQSVVAPLGGLTIVWNLLLAGRPTRAQLLGALITIFGMSLVVWFGPTSISSSPIADNISFQLFTRPRFQILALAYAALSIGLERAKSNLSLSWPWRRAAAGAVGGVVGGLSNVFAKAAVEFYSSSNSNKLEEDNLDWMNMYLVAGIALLLAATQITLFNHALANFPVVSIVPVYMTSLMMSSTVSGGVAFGEFQDFAPGRAIGFAASMLVCVLGVGYLSSAPPSASQQQQALPIVSDQVAKD